MSKEKSAQAMKDGGGSMAYCLGIFGAVVYYIQQADGVLAVFVGIFKALFWPAFLVYELLRFVGA